MATLAVISDGGTSSDCSISTLDFSPTLSTIEADFKIKKSVPLHTTMSIESEMISSLVMH
jgi:hypothetical protein